MAEHKSALKRHRQSLKRNARNRQDKSEIWTLTKRLTAASKEDAGDVLKLLQSKIAKAGRKSVFHHKAASKKIAKMMKIAASK